MELHIPSERTNRLRGFFLCPFHFSLVHAGYVVNALRAVFFQPHVSDILIEKAIPGNFFFVMFSEHTAANIYVFMFQ
jgi:hypothetical protein